MKTEDKFEVWETIKTFYREKFGISPELVDFAPNLDVLRLCASGSSTKSIAAFFGESPDDLAQLIDAYLGFMGWREDLSFSPLKLYKELERPNEADFVDQVVIRYGHKLNMDLHRMYESASMVEKLERLFDEKWI